ncbi:hypothetical protein [Kitasatospora sp. NBC_01302]|uniref:hypothetical protein n=1 Tax=Kitasatospora sp. NBC_01302 TaxID=2903575 RepID=UPI002E0DE2F3|nr:hypothetical protein OG294_23890 [Kitasatospora sp. NBC_01302]
MRLSELRPVANQRTGRAASRSERFLDFLDRQGQVVVIENQDELAAIQCHVATVRQEVLLIDPIDAGKHCAHNLVSEVGKAPNWKAVLKELLACIVGKLLEELPFEFLAQLFVFQIVEREFIVQELQQGSERVSLLCRWGTGRSSGTA